MSIAQALSVFWCRLAHGGGDIERDQFGRINWQCSTCGRWSDPVQLADEAAVVEGAVCGGAGARGGGGEGEGMSEQTLNGVPWSEFETHFKAIHELMCRANLVGGGSVGGSYKGCLTDDRAVTHRFSVSGYERTGPSVEREKAARGKA